MARRRSRFVRSAKSTKIWIGAGVGFSAPVASATLLVASLSAAALLLRPFTILRTRMFLHYSSDQQAVGEEPFGSYGQIVVSEQAVAIGVTAIPNPSGVSGDPEADWFVWQAVSSRIKFASAVGFEESVGVQYVIDSKAMRKVDSNQDVVTIFDQESAFGASLTTNGRMLIQLH